LRNVADYQLSNVIPFASPRSAASALADAEAAAAALDALQADAARPAAAVATIPP
jgi:hypothetical protein